MLSKMGMNMGKGGGKVNVDAMQSNLNQKLKESKNRERLLKKLAEKKMAQAAQMHSQAAATAAAAAKQSQAQAPIENLVFSLGETVERSSRGQSVPQTPDLDSQPKKKNKKNKKKN
jgi:hypothetical protein